MLSRTQLQRLAAGGLAFLPVPVIGHTLDQATYNLAGGMLHPVLGWDHIAAMLAVGIWAAQLGRGARWKIPAAFVACMLTGILVGSDALPTPLVEIGIALSLVALGMLVFTDLRLPLAAGTALVGFLALIHGYAHGMEQSAANLPATYVFGLGLITFLLHLAGVLVGTLLRDTWRPALRAGSAALAGGGIAMLLAMV